MEFPGGNITVTHHFLPHLFPVSSFLLNYARGIFLLDCGQKGVKFLSFMLLFVFPDSGECPVTSFECLGGRCLPLSWHCNGQVECLDEGTAVGTDEQGCGAEVETTESTVYTSTQKGKPHVEVNDSGESESPTVFKSPERHSESDLWDLLKEKLEKKSRVDQEQPQTHGETLVTPPPPIEWPCGGLLQTFYGTFSPPTQRGPPLICMWTIDPQDSRPLRLDLQQLVLGPGDKLVVYNRGDGKGDVLKVVSYICFC